MVVKLDSARLCATTIRIDDPGNLLDYLSPQDACFVRGTDGFVAIGAALRVEGESASNINTWWEKFAPLIENESEMPGEFGTGPLLLASFPFVATSARKSLAYLPKTIIGRRDGVCWVTEIANERVEPKLPERQPDPTLGTITFEKQSPDEWLARVDAVLAELESKNLSKVVLARTLVGHSEQEIDPRVILRRLIQHQPRGWAYLIDGMVGISPALSVHRRYGLTTSRVVAGSLPRTPGQDDLTQTAALISSFSHRASHRHAVDVARGALHDYYTHAHVTDAPYVMFEPTMMSLTTDITGIVPPEHSTMEMMTALHPASILEGATADQLQSILAEHEGLDRERYYGPVGWMDVQGDGSWSEAMNCAQVDDDGHSIKLFTGSGVVQGTTPHREYVETEAKLLSLKNALTG